MLNKSRVYPYKMDDNYKTPKKINARTNQVRKVAPVNIVQCYNEPEYYCIQTTPKKVSFDKKVYVQLIHSREEYDKKMIRQLWWSKPELDDLRQYQQPDYEFEFETKPDERGFFDFLYKLCDWNIDFEY